MSTFLRFKPCFSKGALILRSETTKKKSFKNRRKPLLCLLAPLLALVVLTLLCLAQSRASASPVDNPSGSQSRSLISGGEAAIDKPEASSSAVPVPEQADPNAETLQQTGSWDASVTLTVLVDGETRTMTMKDYLWGVVAAEMPAEFEPDALQAQAVAARTYTLYQMNHPSGAHEADVCADYTCCQAWLSWEDRADKWTESEVDALTEKIAQAVADTDGVVICYGGEPIDAVVHAISAAQTRSSLEVWGADVPYLQSVDSPEGEEVPNYYSTATVSLQEFRDALPELDLSGDPSGWIGETHYDEGGLPVSVDIGGQSVETTELRSRFGLRSSCVTLEAGSEGVTFYVTGYGHGVGMSQYGANALAQQGYSWQDILTWYYSGVTLENYADKTENLG